MRTIIRRVALSSSPAKKPQYNRARRDILLEFDTAGIPYVLPAILEKEACRQMLTHGCLLHDLPKHAKVSNIEVAFDNVEALLRNIIASL